MLVKQLYYSRITELTPEIMHELLDIVLRFIVLKVSSAIDFKSYNNKNCLRIASRNAQTELF